MTHPRRPFLLVLMLLAIGLRTTLGAPCCMPSASAGNAVEDQLHHAEHAVNQHAADGHEGHGDDPSAKPCCSACGPTLPPEPLLFTASNIAPEVHQPAAIRELETRPPFPAYEATGPPLLI